MALIWVDPKYLDTVWPKVEGWLSASVATTLGDCTVEQLRLQVVSHECELLLYEQDGQIIGVATIEFVNFPQRRVAFVTQLGGRGVVTKQAFLELKEWARQQGAFEVRAACDASRARLYRRVGLSALYQVVGG